MQIEQVLVNLFKNAAEAMPDGKRAEIDVTARSEGNWLYLVVCDNGPGIAPELMNSLFKSFVPTRKPSGMGLGLAISRAIAHENGGNLTAGQNGDTGGAQFTLILLPKTPPGARPSD